MADGQVAPLMAHAPSVAQAAVLVPSATAATSEVLAGAPTVRGYAFEPAPAAVDYDALLRSLGTTGFQGTAFERAVRVVNDMLAWRLSSEPVPADEADEWRDPARRAATRCTVFLAYTSNLISSGVRDIIRFLVQHRFVHVLVSTAGGVEEDFIKCLAPTYVGDFELDGRTLRKQGLNRIGNLLVPNDNYCKFEDWVTPILDQLLKEQKEQGIVWTPSKIIHRLGKEINHPDSVYYWAYKNNIPVFCPALTDGSLGDMIYFHSYRNPGLVVDIAGDIRAINDIALHAKKTGMIILGGGVVKHHTANANLMRNGADFSVYINTAQEFDGSDSGARPDEAVSWGKIKMDSHPVKVYGDATVIFPLLVAQTFAKQATQSV